MMSRVIIDFIVKYFYYTFLAFIILNFIMGRKNAQIQKKRFAVLYFAISIFALYMYALFLKNKNLFDIYLSIYFIVIIPVYIIFKKYLFPFQLKCEKCNKFLKLSRIMFTDHKKCEDCESANEDEKKELE